MALKRFILISASLHILIISIAVLIPLRTGEPPGPVIFVMFENPSVQVLEEPPPPPPTPPPPLRPKPAKAPVKVAAKPAPEPPGEMPQEKKPADMETAKAEGLKGVETARGEQDLKKAGSDRAEAQGEDGSLMKKLFDRDIIAGIAGKEEERTAALSFYPEELRHRSYMARLKDIIESTWVYPRRAIEKEIYGDLVIWFVINKDGRLGDAKLMRTSGHEILDEAALKALRNAAPFWPLPEGWGVDGIEIRGKFTYSLYGGLYIR